MNIGHRIFVVEDDSVVRLSQKSFNEFSFREKASLLQYAGRMIVIAIAIYELKNRKPKRVIRIDTERVKVNADGSRDKEHLLEGLALVAKRISFGNNPPRARVKDSSIVDAKAHFDERRWNQRHPELSGPALKNILASLFGTAHDS